MKQLSRGILATLAVAACSCSEEESFTPQEEGLSEEQIEKIAYGCDSYASGDGKKMETDASDEYMEMLRERLENERNTSWNKVGKNMQYVGVVKDKTCGKYDEVRIYYDCQDHSANDTYYHGYKGDWHVTQNITMYFCVVPVELFKNTRDNYAVMNFSSDNFTSNNYENKNIGLIEGYMDSEDSKCKTTIYYTRRGEKEVEDKYNTLTGNTKLSGNRNLAYQMFQFFSDNTSKYGYPDLGFDYGVFGMFNHTGKFDDKQGMVHSDDEDSHNANDAYCTSTGINGRTEKKQIKGTYHYGILKVDRNTEFFIAKISTKK